ncbi:hypothetical protein SCLCIDRAFT_482059 [Scleroderma citrinum Foug A]|uniref:MI domain-containing protein n=1 Tax=Scleroderma citrinum Foug A TaxID=1036808 RepID=A0A0C3CWC3_9AGAM|nr:hypothetical protein SCLCIDRAFT_482059 [Scleroderma citrinum Foug A]
MENLAHPLCRQGILHGRCQPLRRRHRLLPALLRHLQRPLRLHPRLHPLVRLRRRLRPPRHPLLPRPLQLQKTSMLLNCSRPSSSQQPQQPPAQVGQLGTHPYTTFVPNMRPRGTSGPGSPAFSRSVPNGAGAQSRPMAGPGGPPIPASPRLAPPNHPHPPPTTGVPPQQVPMQHMSWGAPAAYYYMDAYNTPPWYYPMQPPHGMHQQHPPPTPHAPGPGPQGPHPGMPMSPRTQPPSLPPGTPTMPHAVPTPHTPQPPPHSHQPSSSISISSPPPTPVASSGPGGRLNTEARAFIPNAGRQNKAITIKSEDGTEVKLEALKKHSPQPSTAPIPVASPMTISSRIPSVRIESEEDKRKRQEQARLEQQKKEAEERAKREEEERKRKEEEEAKRKAVEEAEREKREEEERIRKTEEEERQRQEEAERKRKEEEAARLEEERRREERQKEETERAERELREKEEKEQKEREEKELAEQQAEEQRLKEAADQDASNEGNLVDSPANELQDLEPEEGEVIENGEVSEQPVNGASKSLKQKESLRIDTSESAKRRLIPLDINAAKKDSSSPPLSALMTARNIDRLDEIEYPQGIKSPRTELNQNAKDGKFRYDRDFLLQFMQVCKEKPPHLPALDILGLEPVDQASYTMTRGGSGRHRQASAGVSMSGPRSASIGLGVGGGFKPSAPPNPFQMGQFSTPPGSKLTSEERFMISSGARSASVGSGPTATALLNRPAMTRTPSQGGPGHPMGSNRTRSKRGEKRNDPGKSALGQQGPVSGYGSTGSLFLEPVAPLEMSTNRWVASSTQRKAADTDTPEVVNRKVRALLNKLTVEKFEPISDQIIAWANKSENEKDGRTLIQVIRLVFEKATDEANWSEMYARLCRKMMETISPKVQDDGIKNADGKPIAGGQLFRKYLLNRCQEDFERGWVAKEATARAAAAKASDDQAIKAANEKKGDDSELYSEEYYAAQKAKRQGLGLIKFIGELFKLQMLTERIMHECVKKLLGNVDNPEEEEIESLCQLLRTVGRLLDVPKAHAHMDVYFSRMKELGKSGNVTSRMQFMLQDVIELRERKWLPRNVVNAPTTLAQVHETAAKDRERAAQESQAHRGQYSMSRGGSKRGTERGTEPGPDGWAVAGGSQPRPPPKAGDLSQFGKISKVASMVMGPSSVFTKKDSKRESMTRTNSSSNMFSMLNTELVETKPSRAPSRRPSTDLDKPEPVPQRKRLQLLPRTKLSADESAPTASEDEPETTPVTQMSEADAMKRIDEDVKEFFAVRNHEEADVYFTVLSEEHRFRLVDKLVSLALESKEADARLVAEFFARPASQRECSLDVFEAGFVPMTELLDDIAIDAPKAFEYMAIMLKGAGLDRDEERLKRIVEKATDSDKLLQLVSS